MLTQVTNFVNLLKTKAFGIISLIIGLIGLVLYFKKEADQANTESLISKTEGKDEVLAQEQGKNEQEIKKVDKDIRDLYDERAKLRDQYLSDQERADKWNK